MSRFSAVLRPLLVLSALACAAAHAQAPAWPSKPVRLLVAFAAGGPIDLAARVVADGMTQKLGQPVVVENRTGANGAIAAEAVKAAPPDGHTVLVSNASMITITPTLVKDLKYEPLRDFEPVTRIVQSSLVLVVNPEAPDMRDVRTLADLIAVAKRKPGELSYGSAGLNGNVQQLAFELFADQAGIKLVAVPYKGASEAQLALLGQQVTLSFDTMTAVPHIKAGKLRPLAVSSRERLPELPDVPTMQELGYRNFEIGFWSGVFVPKGTPAPVVQALAKAIGDAAADPAARPKLDVLGRVVTSSPDDFRRHIQAETQTLADVIKRANLAAR
ncbi:MAG: tripartite tricarboxylate transporter substrate binding protein [Rubrivivax sp.]|nr:tripartite tricarboxylate transporter substrate binding protein [Rubrivivax sp.]